VVEERTDVHQIVMVKVDLFESDSQAAQAG